VNIEFNLGRSEYIGKTFMLHVRGGNDSVGEITRMCRENNWIAFDISNGRFIDNDSPASESFERWIQYRDKIIQTGKAKKKWWRFW
jgi:hypothetical protein